MFLGAIESGFYDYERRKYVGSASNKKLASKPEPFTINHILGSIFILLPGQLISLLCFLSELVPKKKSSRLLHKKLSLGTASKNNKLEKLQ